MRSFALVLVGLATCLAACARGGNHGTSSDAPRPPADASPDVPDSPMPGPDASCPSPGAAGPHLLLTEVALTPAGSEFIEIANPTAATVDLSNYYLSDSGAYWKLPVASPNLGAADFIARFPTGATIDAGAVVTVATGSVATFMTAYSVAPTYSIQDGTMSTVASNGTPSLTNAGEIIVLFQWDGSAPLVADVDLLLAGIPDAANGLVSKSHMSQLGCTYATDADTIAAQPSAPPAGKSTKRIALEGSSEIHAGGNGITGDDETSENTATTWDTSFSVSTPGTVPSGLLP